MCRQGREGGCLVHEGVARACYTGIALLYECTAVVQVVRREESRVELTMVEDPVDPTIFKEVPWGSDTSGLIIKIYCYDVQGRRWSK